MRYTKLMKLGAVGLALLLIPRRSSRLASGYPRPTDSADNTVDGESHSINNQNKKSADSTSIHPNSE